MFKMLPFEIRWEGSADTSTMDIDVYSIWAVEDTEIPKEYKFDQKTGKEVERCRIWCNDKVFKISGYTKESMLELIETVRSGRIR